QPAARLARQDADVLLSAVEMPRQVIFLQAEGLPAFEVNSLVAESQRDDAVAAPRVPSRNVQGARCTHGRSVRALPSRRQSQPLGPSPGEWQGKTGQPASA